jgi:hypothetical protein
MNGITISQRAFDKIVFFEITSEALYKKRYQKPHWPGEQSGITLGIGFDLGYHSYDEFYKAWGSHLSIEDIASLREVIGLKGVAAQQALASVLHINIPLSIAKKVFEDFSLDKAAKELLLYSPQVKELFPDAQGGLLSLVFNRGRGTKDKPGSTRRKEMKIIQGLIPKKDYAGIAAQITAMKRLWPAGSSARVVGA